MMWVGEEMGKKTIDHRPQTTDHRPQDIFIDESKSAPRVQSSEVCSLRSVVCLWSEVFEMGYNRFHN